MRFLTGHGEVHFTRLAGNRKVEAMNDRYKQPASLSELVTRARDYAEVAMRNVGHVPPTMFAATPDGLLHFVPQGLQDHSHPIGVAWGMASVGAYSQGCPARSTCALWPTGSSRRNPLEAAAAPDY